MTATGKVQKFKMRETSIDELDLQAAGAIVIVVIIDVVVIMVLQPGAELSFPTHDVCAMGEEADGLVVDAGCRPRLEDGDGVEGSLPSVIDGGSRGCGTGRSRRPRPAFFVSRTIWTAPSRNPGSNFLRFSSMTTSHSRCLHGNWGMFSAWTSSSFAVRCPPNRRPSIRNESVLRQHRFS